MSYELMFQKALQLQQDGALQEAERIYRQILETAPEHVDCLNMLGLIAQNKGFHQEAVDYFFRAIKNAPRHFPLYFNVAVSLAAMQKYSQAEESFLKALELKPDLKEAYFELGNICWQQNNLSEAEKFFTAALNIDKNYLEAETNLAEIKDDVVHLQKISSGNPTALYYLGRRAMVDHNYSAAKNYLALADQRIKAVEIKKLLAQCLLEQNHKDQALQIFYQAYALAPTDSEIAVFIADIEADQKNSDIAEMFYKKAINLDPKNLKAHADYADFLVQANRTLEALEEYRSAVLIAPETPELSYNLAVILRNLEEYEQALDLMFFAFYKIPQNQEWMLSIAETLILFYSKHPDQAQKIVQNWLQKMPQCIAAIHLNDIFSGRQSSVEKQYNNLLFDHFSPTYEKTMEKIKYNVADQIASLLCKTDQKILDLGCGTGLLGVKIKNDQRSVDGVDLSKNMLQKASEKNIYANLFHDDLIHHLQTHQSTYDAIVAADVFCYIANLSQIFTLCAPQKIIFSIEADENIDTFSPIPAGRYKHNPKHIESLLKQAGYLYIEAYPTILRYEGDEAVKGIIFTARS